MSAEVEFHVIPNGRRRQPCAVIGPRSLQTVGGVWSWPWVELERWQRVASKLLPRHAVFDAHLSSRWGRLVACTPQFSRKWKDRTDEQPEGFSLKVEA